MAIPNKRRARINGQIKRFLGKAASVGCASFAAMRKDAFGTKRTAEVVC
jgi:hypothetical protein